MEISQEVDLPGDLVFRDIPDYRLTDDLSGKPLDATMVTAAKHEEVVEIYTRTVWEERLVAGCIRDTGKQPSPVGRVSTSKGDGLHPNARCRLVAKHLAAKYGCKGAEDLFAAMPPFELVKALLVKAVQRRDWKREVHN